MIVVVTKVLCYHQIYIADDMYEIYGDNFKFIQMREPLDWRVKNKQEGFKRPYVVSYKRNSKLALNLIKNADVIIFGEAPLKLIRHKNKNCLVFKMSENIFKDTLSKISIFGKIKRWLSYKYLQIITNNKRSYLLSCGAFAYSDYLRLRIFKNRALKWGYFPYIPQIDERVIVDKFSHFETIELIWVSRLIGLKNPLYLIQLTEFLLENNITNFHLTIVGNSDESDVDYFSLMKQAIEDKQLSKYISLVGKVDANKVFDYYLKSHIALFTSDKSEGWSVGIGEAMSCGCAVISSNTIGATPFLVGSKNGLVFKYDSVNDFCEKVKWLIENKQQSKDFADNGYALIKDLWNHKVASSRLCDVINNYLTNKEIIYFENGPCSKIEKIDYDWYLKKK